MAQNPRITRRITRIKADLAIIQQWLDGNSAGIEGYKIGSRDLRYLDPIRLMELKNKLEEELEGLEFPGGRFRRAVPIR